MTELTGGCLCGSVRYACSAPDLSLGPPTFCHCRSCSRAAGAHIVAWFTVAQATFDFTTDSPKEYESSPGVLRTFCGRCGTSLSYRNKRRLDEIDVTIASLDEPALLWPADHIWMCDAVIWDKPADRLPQYWHTRSKA